MKCLVVTEVDPTMTNLLEDVDRSSPPPNTKLPALAGVGFFRHFASFPSQSIFLKNMLHSAHMNLL